MHKTQSEGAFGLHFEGNALAEETSSSLSDDDDENQRTLFVANIDDRVTEDLLYEVFLQAGPVESARIPRDNSGRQRTFGFITFTHRVSLPYAIQLLSGLQLYRKNIVIRLQENAQQQQPHYHQHRRSYPPYNHPIVYGQNSESVFFPIGAAAVAEQDRTRHSQHVNPFKQQIDDLTLMTSSSSSALTQQVHERQQAKVAVATAPADWTRGNSARSRHGKRSSKKHTSSPYYRGGSGSSGNATENSNRHHRHNNNDRRSEQRNNRSR